ncbi:MAG TPA: anhydro-N-acetylmuramic acid kinase, partial [Roseivirga sp.]
MKEKKKYVIIGAMSGTSLDGLDLAQVSFQKEEDSERWNFKILAAFTQQYTEELKQELRTAIDLQTEQIELLSKQFGEFIGQAILSFKKGLTINTDFIASHGHTVFHQPSVGITKQIGDAQEIYRITEIPVINNFREADVKAGGQGAPLVPIGDRDLFPEHDMALNLGGIANISFEANTGRIAFDICPFNIALNELAAELGFDYDENGKLS